jgi:hypothetical protein
VPQVPQRTPRSGTRRGAPHPAEILSVLTLGGLAVSTLFGSGHAAGLLWHAHYLVVLAVAGAFLLVEGGRALLRGLGRHLRTAAHDGHARRRVAGRIVRMR